MKTKTAPRTLANIMHQIAIADKRRLRPRSRSPSRSRKPTAAQKAAAKKRQIMHSLALQHMSHMYPIGYRSPSRSPSR